MNVGVSPFFVSGTYLIRVSASALSSSAAELETTGNAVHEPGSPSRLYSQPPFPVFVVMAIPSTAAVSASVIEMPTRSVTRSPAEVTSSSVIDVKNGVAVDMMGASLTPVTVIVTVRMAVNSPWESWAWYVNLGLGVRSTPAGRSWKSRPGFGSNVNVPSLLLATDPDPGGTGPTIV